MARRYSKEEIARMTPMQRLKAQKEITDEVIGTGKKIASSIGNFFSERKRKKEEAAQREWERIERENRERKSRERRALIIKISIIFFSIIIVTGVVIFIIKRQELPQGIERQGPGFFGAIGQFFSGVGGAIKNFFVGIFEAIKGFFGNLFSTIKGFFVKVPEIVANIIDFFKELTKSK
jgi:hypothetical protein